MHQSKKCRCYAEEMKVLWEMLNKKGGIPMSCFKRETLIVHFILSQLLEIPTPVPNTRYTRISKIQSLLHYCWYYDH
jgi:hypothetical protein